MNELRLEPVGDLEDVSADWAVLARRSGNVFSTWEWTSLWWRHFGNERRLLVTACRDGEGGILAILPLYLSSTRPIRTIRLIGHGPADELGPVCDPADAEQAARSLGRALAQHCPPWDIFIGEQLRGNQNWSALLGGTTLRRDASPVLRVDGASWDQFLASRTSNFRGQVRRRERKLAREHKLRYRLSAAETLEQDLETLVRLHESQSNAAFVGARRTFHREFAALALQRGWLRLWLMEVDEHPVAAWYGLRFEGAECYYQSGRDSAWDDYSVGFVLLVHTMREAFDDGMREYRLLRGGESYKDRFASEDRGLETVGVYRTAAGRASLWAAIAAGSMPRPAKRLLTRLAG